VEVDARERVGKLAAELLRQRVRVLHRVELHHPLRFGDVIGLERKDLRPDEVLRLHLNLISAARACAGRPSPSARVLAILPSEAAALFDTEMTLVRFWKS